MKSLFVWFFIFTSGGAQAGEFFERNGFALGGYDPVSYFKNGEPQKGTEAIRTTHRGSIFLFASNSNREEFLAQPEKFSPQFNGFCAYGVAGGYKAKTEPEAFTVLNGKLYLNYDLSVQKKWLKDTKSYIEKGDKNWPSVSSTTKVY